MESIRQQLKPWEHCPDCGAMVVAVAGGAICPHCGCEVEEPEERMFASVSRLSWPRNESSRFLHLDDGPDTLRDEAA